jgi:ankyrin repeat protein
MLPYIGRDDIETMAFLATERGHHQVLELFLKRAELSSNLRRHRQTILMCAVSTVQSDCVRILLEYGANIHEVNHQPQIAQNLFNVSSGSAVWFSSRKPYLEMPDLSTALHILAGIHIRQDMESSWKAILNMLLAAGADIEAKDGGGNTPLLASFRSDSRKMRMTESPEFLISAGANPHAINKDGNSILHLACERGMDKELFGRMLELGANPNQRRVSDGATPLHSAAESFGPCYENNKVIEYMLLLLEKGADVNAKDNCGNTPLHIACHSISRQKFDTVKFLLRNGSRVNETNDRGQTCLHYFEYFKDTSAGGYGQLKPYDDAETVYALLDAGIDLELFDHNGMAVLHVAASMKATSMLDALLKYPRKPCFSVRTIPHGKTPLHIAISSYEPAEMIEKLFNHGADPNWIDNQGNTLLHELASQFDGTEKRIMLVEKLLQLGVSPETVNCKLQTALHIFNRLTDWTSTWQKTFSSVLLQLASALDVNKPDSQGYTPLHYAAAHSEAETFNLLAAGADINAKSFNGRTPLHCAARARQSGNLAMLINAAKDQTTKIHLDAVDAEGRTPLHDACSSGRPESVKILIEAGSSLKSPSPSISYFKACTEFAREKSVWDVLCQNSSPKDTIFQDPFRPVFIQQRHDGVYEAKDDHKHKGVRIGETVKMLITTPEDTRQAWLTALQSNSLELFKAVRRIGFEEIPREPLSLKETQLLFLSKPEVLAMKGSEGNLMWDLVKAISEIDEATMAGMIENGIDFTGYQKHTGHYPETTVIHRIAILGLTEHMRLIISKAKAFDDPNYILQTAHGDIWIAQRMTPLLHTACRRPYWNLDMVRLLLSVGQVDVNARHWIRSQTDSTQKLISGEAALHILAQGISWWQVEAIRLLAKHGKLEFAPTQN